MPTILTPRELPVRRKLFVSYHHGRDRGYYTELARLCDDSDFLEDNSVGRRIGGDDAGYHERRIREDYITGTTATIVLVGVETFQRKFVDWEICATLLKEHGLIGLRLPYVSPNPSSGKVIVPQRLYDNFESGYALWRNWTQLAQSQVPAAVLRGWIEEALRRDKGFIRNALEKKAQNG